MHEICTNQLKIEILYIVTVSRIKDETGVNIRIPQDGQNDNMIKIEGETSGVAQAKQELLEMVNKLVSMWIYLHIIRYCIISPNMY